MNDVQQETIAEAADQAKRVQEGLKDGSVEFVSMDKLGRPKLPPLPYNYSAILDQCIQLIQSQRQTHVVLPIQEYQDTKKNRVRVHTSDKTSPMGVVMKNDVFARAEFHPYASASFDLYDMVRWLATKTAQTEETPVDQNS